LQTFSVRGGILLEAATAIPSLSFLPLTILALLIVLITNAFAPFRASRELSNRFSRREP
jgi:hypothetical protein